MPQRGPAKEVTLTCATAWTSEVGVTRALKRALQIGADAVVLTGVRETVSVDN